MAGIVTPEASKFYRDLFPFVTDRLTEGKISPFFAAIEVTSRCNFRCLHCQTSSRIPRGGLSTRRLLSILDQLADLGTFGLILTGGEPLTRPDIFEILARAKQREFAITLCTNASLVTRSIADRLAAFYLNDVLVSLYGMDEDTHRRVTGVSGACACVLDNIRLLVDRGVRVTVRMPLLKWNIGQVEEAQRFARRIGTPFVAEPVIHATYDGGQGPLDHRPTSAQMKRFFLDNPGDLAPTFSIGNPGGRVCAGPHEQVAINSQGEVLPCVFHRRGVPLKGRRIASVMKNEPIFRRVSSMRWRDLPGCLKCKALAYCRPCPGLFQLEGGSLLKKAVNAVCRVAWLKKRLYEERRHQ